MVVSPLWRRALKERPKNAKALNKMVSLPTSMVNHWHQLDQRRLVDRRLCWKLGYFFSQVKRRGISDNTDTSHGRPKTHDSRKGWAVPLRYCNASGDWATSLCYISQVKRCGISETLTFSSRPKTHDSRKGWAVPMVSFPTVW